MSQVMSIEKITKEHNLSQSENLVESNIDKLKALFPEIVTEGKIDFNVLQEVLGDELEHEEEYYRFTWAGKANARREAQKPSTGTLRPAPEESVDWDTTKNLYIEGDNLEVLKLLQKGYAGKVKMIYIDPPYNTGNDFVYKDNYKDNLRNYQEVTGQVDDEGNKLSTNSDSDGRYHSNWLNMMYPRLRLARNLLSEDGVIFMSIDDNEVDNLIKLSNEIFGEENFINTISVKAKPSSGASGGGEDKKLKKNVEYLICYSKNRNYFDKFNDVWDSTDLFEYIEDYKNEGKSWKYTRVIESFGEKSFHREIVDGAGEPIKIFKHENVVFKTIKELSNSDGISNEEVYMKYFDKVFRDTNAQSSIRQRVMDATDNLDTFYSIEYVPRSGRSKNQLTTLYYKGKNKDLIAWLSDVSIKTNDTLIKKDKLGTLWSGFNWNNISKEGDIKYPNGKKPIDFICKMIELSSSESKDDIIMDFFSGSASSAHAVFNSNFLDSGNRKSISVQLPEVISSKDIKDNYSDKLFSHIKNVCDIGKERLRRAAKKIAEENPEKAKNLDLGFKVFKLDTSNIKGWDGNPDNLDKSLFDTQDNMKTDRTEHDVLYEILLKYGLDLTLPIEEKQIAGKTVFSVGFGALFICLAEDITNKVAQGIGEWKEELQPEVCRVVFKDSGFTDVEKTNSVQTLKRFGITEIKSI
jgi:adenine-specific DNA-methyltransferase